MEQFKFDFFKKEHSGQTMNVFTLSKAECDKVFASFCSAYNMEKQERNQVFDIIQDKGIPVNFTNAEDKNFDLASLNIRKLQEAVAHTSLCMLGLFLCNRPF